MPSAKKKVTRTSRRVVGRRKKPAARPVSSAIASPLVKKTIDPGWTWDDRLPLSQAKQIGNTIYLSGQVAYDASGQLVGEGDMKAQTRQVFDNIRSVLGAADARMEDIVKINTYITDSSNFMDMLGARSEIFGSDPPASTAVVVQALAFPGLLIEVEAIAIKP